MKKTRAIVLICLLAVATQGFAKKSTPDLAIGAELTSVNLNTVGAMLALHLPGIPLFIGFGADFSNELSGDIELTSTIDYWLAYTSGGYVNVYIGLGLYGAMNLDASWYALGARLPIGLQVWPLNSERLEMFLEVAPAWVPVYGGLYTPATFQAQLAVGLRFWFELGK